MKTKRLLVILLLIGTVVFLGLPVYGAPQKPGEDLTFLMTVHTGPGHTFWERVHKGAQDAADALGVKLIWAWGMESPEYVASKAREGIAMGVDGIAMCGLEPGVLVDIISEIKEAGIPIIMFNSDDPESVRQAFVGQDIKGGGVLLARYFVDHVEIPPEGGHVLYSAGAPEWTYSLLREEGQKEVLEEYGITYEVMEYTFDMDVVARRYTAWLKANPKPLGIIAGDAYGLMMISDVLDTLGYSPGEIPVIGYDVNEKILEGLEEGYILATLDQQQYIQGWFSIQNLFLAAKYMVAPVSMDTGSFMLDASNMEKIIPLIEKGIR